MQHSFLFVLSFSASFVLSLLFKLIVILHIKWFFLFILLLTSLCINTSFFDVIKLRDKIWANENIKVEWWKKYVLSSFGSKHKQYGNKTQERNREMKIKTKQKYYRTVSVINCLISFYCPVLFSLFRILLLPFLCFASVTFR